jgi:hypothetical protein
VIVRVRDVEIARWVDSDTRGIVELCLADGTVGAAGDSRLPGDGGNDAGRNDDLANPCGPWNCAAELVASTKPPIPAPPAIVVTNPADVTLRMVWFRVSAT